MIIDDLITSRTEAEAKRARELLMIGWAHMTAAEKSEYAATHGLYRSTDVNRVSEAEEYVIGEYNDFIDDLAAAYATAILSILASLQFPSSYYTIDNPVLPTSYGDAGYDEITLSPVKTDWTDEDIQSPAETPIDYYLTNLARIRNALPMDAPNAPATLNGLNFETANAIEQILKVAYNTLQAHITAKNNALQDAEDAAKEKYRMQAVSWITGGEFLANEVNI